MQFFLILAAASKSRGFPNILLIFIAVHIIDCIGNNEPINNTALAEKWI